eukprot:213476_1
MDALIDIVDNCIINQSKSIVKINNVIYPPNIDGELNGKIKTKVIYDDRTNSYTVECPYCNELTVVLAKHFNCKTFRHGAFLPKNKKHKHLINKYKPINPHEKWQKISQYLTEKRIIGCGGAFKIIGKPKVDKTNMYAVTWWYKKSAR